MTTDFRALCARMADELDHYRQLLTDNRLESHPLSAEARAALAQQVPEGPTDQELYDVAEQFNGDPIPAMRRALELWGRPAVEPVPVAERLPKDSDCGWWPNEKKPEAFGWCWLWDGSKWERYQVGHMLGCKLPDVFTHWVSHWALPVPQEGE